MFIILELTSIIGYLYIMKFNKKIEADPEAGLKYFINNFLSLICFILALYDISITSRLENTTLNYTTLLENSYETIGLLVMAFVIKLNLFPVYF